MCFTLSRLFPPEPHGGGQLTSGLKPEPSSVSFGGCILMCGLGLACRGIPRVAGVMLQRFRGRPWGHLEES
jgi:hypothetical protein